MEIQREQELFRRYPRIFSERALAATETAMNRGVEAGNGWFDLLDGLCATLQQDVDERDTPQVVASQVKEKLGSLRFRVRSADDRQMGMIALAEALSTRVCEECGRPGTMAHEGWKGTRCGLHAAISQGSAEPDIRLTPEAVDATLPFIAEGLREYVWIQQGAANGEAPLSSDTEFQKRFNYLYGTGRRTSEWREAFFELMEDARGRHLSFDAALIRLLIRVRAHEASFASKLVATFDEASPIIDSNVMKNLGMLKPHHANHDLKTKAWIARHARLRDLYEDYLQSPWGCYLRLRFTEMYPHSVISDAKQLDFVLWKYEGPSLVGK